MTCRSKLNLLLYLLLSLSTVCKLKPQQPYHHSSHPNHQTRHERSSTLVCLLLVFVYFFCFEISCREEPRVHPSVLLSHFALTVPYSMNTHFIEKKTNRLQICCHVRMICQQYSRSQSPSHALMTAAPMIRSSIRSLIRRITS